MPETLLHCYVQSEDLHCYKTGDYLRPATPDEAAESKEAAKRDGGAGVILAPVARPENS